MFINDIAPNGWLLDKNGNEIKHLHKEDKILGAKEVLISLYDLASNEKKILGLKQFISKIDDLIDLKVDF